MDNKKFRTVGKYRCMMIGNFRKKKQTMPSMTKYLARVIMPDDFSAGIQYIKGKGWEVILRLRAPCGAGSALLSRF